MKKILSIFSVSLFFIVGCTTATIEEARINNEKTEATITEKSRTFEDYTNPAVVIEDELYLGNKREFIKPKVVLPERIHRNISVGSGQPINLSEVSEMIALSSGIKVYFTPDAVASLAGGEGQSSAASDSTGASGGEGSQESALNKYSMQLLHEGSVKNLLDTITARTNLFWKWDGSRVVVFRHVTKNFIVKAFAGKTTVTSNVQGGAPGGDDALNNSQSAGIDQSNVDIWAAIKNEVSAQMTPEGKFAVSDSLGSLTVTDTPYAIERVDAFIRKINDTLTKQVMLRIEVYEVQANDEDENGIDWSALYAGSSSSFSFDTSIFPGTTPPNVTMGIVKPTSKWDGSQSFVTALQTKNKVSHVTSEDVITLSGQAAPVRVQTEQGYLSSSKTTVSDGTTTTELVPATTTSGVSITVLPKVINHREVMVQFALDIANLEQLVTFSSGDSSIQLPTRTVKNFMQRVLMRTGSTLVLSGYKRSKSEDDYRGILGETFAAAGGKVKGGSERSTTLILMTPYIIEA